jgi:hypothetical protein
MRSIVNAWIADMKEDRKGRTSCQDARRPIQRSWTQIQEKRRPLWSGSRFLRKRTQFIPRASKNERTTCQEETEANAEKMETTDFAIAILEIMEATDLKANPEEMQSESEYREVPKKDTLARPVRGRKKRHRGRHQAAG